MTQVWVFQWGQRRWHVSMVRSIGWLSCQSNYAVAVRTFVYDTGRCMTGVQMKADGMVVGGFHDTATFSSVGHMVGDYQDAQV